MRLGLMRPHMPRKRRDGTAAFVAPQPYLAREKVRYIGDPVALVVAETLEQAKDAAEAIAVEYDTLPAVAATGDAIARAPSRCGMAARTTAFTHTAATKRPPRRRFDGAAHVISHRMVINRLTTNSMEPRGCLAEFDTRDGALYAALHRAGAAHDPPDAGGRSLQGGRERRSGSSPTTSAAASA